MTLPEVQVKLKEDQQMREDAKAANGLDGASESAYSSACREDGNDSLQKRQPKVSIRRSSAELSAFSTVSSSSSSGVGTKSSSSSSSSSNSPHSASPRWTCEDSDADQHQKILSSGVQPSSSSSVRRRFSEIESSEEPETPWKPAASSMSPNNMDAISSARKRRQEILQEKSESAHRKREHGAVRVRENRDQQKTQEKLELVVMESRLVDAISSTNKRYQEILQKKSDSARKNRELRAERAKQNRDRVKTQEKPKSWFVRLFRCYSSEP